MTIRDREVIEELRDEPELLALADAVVETQRIRRSFRPWRAATVLALAGALFLLVLASPWDRGSSNVPILERALAGIPTRGPVLHAVLSYSDGWRVELATGKTTRRSTFAEVWYDKDRSLARVVVRRDGKMMADRTVSGSERDLAFALLFPIPLDETDFYREALAREEAKVVGEGTWRGRPVYWLELRRRDAPSTMQVGVDRETYQPVVMRSVNSEGKPAGNEIGLVDLEYIPRSQAHFGEVEGKAGSEFSAGGSSFSSDDSLSPARARTALGVTAAWAGETLEGLPLRRIWLAEASYQAEGKQEHTDKQLQLVYGGARPPGLGGSGVTISELAAGSPVWASSSEGPPPPAGFADLTSQVGTDGHNKPSTTWYAIVAIGQIWATVEAPTRELVLAAARQLRPIS